MTWLLENPVPIVICGALLVVALGAAWAFSGRMAWFYAMLVALLATAALWGLERLVETDREAITGALRAAAADVERNDLNGALAHTHSQAPAVRDQARVEFPKYLFETVSIKQNLTVQVDRQANPPEARAEFNVVVTASERAGAVQHMAVPRYVIVTFRLEGEAWRVFAYEHHPPEMGWKKRD